MFHPGPRPRNPRLTSAGARDPKVRYNPRDGGPGIALQLTAVIRDCISSRILYAWPKRMGTSHGAARGDSGVNLVLVESPVRFGEVIPPGGPVRVIGTTHPLHAVADARIKRDLEVGLTVAELLEGALRDRARGSFIVSVDGNLIDERCWPMVCAKPGPVVTFLTRLQGSNALARCLASQLQWQYRCWQRRRAACRWASLQPRVSARKDSNP